MKDPFVYPIEPGCRAEYRGLTKREFYAAMAMQGMLANPEQGKIPTEALVQNAVTEADALIEELNK